MNSNLSETESFECWATKLHSSQLQLHNLDYCSSILDLLLNEIKPKLSHIDTLLSQYRAKTAFAITNNNPDPHNFLPLLPKKESIDCYKILHYTVTTYMDSMKHALNESKSALEIALPKIQPFEETFNTYSCIEESTTSMPSLG